MLKLTTWERLMILEIVGGQTGTAAEIRAASKTLDAVEFTPQEREWIMLVNGPSGWSWDPKDTRLWDVAIPDPMSVKRALDSFNRWAARDLKKIDALLAKF